MSAPKRMNAGLLSVLDEKQAQASTTRLSPHPPSTLRPLRNNTISTRMIGEILHELDVTERLLRSNAGGSCFVFLGGLLARFICAPPPSLNEAVAATMNTLAVGFMCSYRPIPAGLITVDQARAGWFLSWTLGPLAVHHFFGFWATVHLLSLEATIAFCYVWPRWFSWFMRNLFAFLLYLIQDRLLTQALLGAANLSVLIDLGVSTWFIGTIHVQEFHDLEGDRKSDRKTLPMLLSPRGLRLLRAGTSVYITAFGATLAFIGYQKMGQDNILIKPMSVLQLVASPVLAYRIWTSTSTEMDRVTFYNYYYVPVFIILLPLPLVTK
ncbi:hypothetical protein PG994_003430 [Apiospora phragmitis]|uniref:UbiA prenyltransferase family-domain-containing protein n=1 Tax=Apiospora phragmitis TaxID=2905665 RepID=A0ABR1W216_9PEZI